MPTILVCGSAVLDFVFRMDRMPERAEKYRAEAAEIVGGGCAANAAVAIAHLGGTAHLIGRRGEDVVGRMITADLKMEGVDTRLFRAFPGGRSAFSSIYLDAAGERQIMAFRGSGLPSDAAWIAEAPVAAAALTDTRWPEGAAALMALARARSIPAVLDGEAGDDADPALEAASHIVFSRQGLRAYAGTDDIGAGLIAARARYGGWVAVTDGGAGVFYLADGVQHVPAFPVEAVDTLGAGDVWHGAFTLALAEGRDEGQAIRFASATAALKCTRPGGRLGTPKRAEVEAFLGVTTP
ncbi:MAG: PfkB family carbohydrate kinase [Pseudomonadota bacterium]